VDFWTGDTQLDSLLDNHINAIQRRGPSFCTDTWGRPKSKGLIKVVFNQKGQPIGLNRNSLSSFLGTVARNGKHAPLNYRSWTVVPKTYKQDMINIVKVGEEG
jgi:hypothetical protein